MNETTKTETVIVGGESAEIVVVDRHAARFRIGGEGDWHMYYIQSGVVAPHREDPAFHAAWLAGLDGVIWRLCKDFGEGRCDHSGADIATMRDNQGNFSHHCENCGEEVDEDHGAEV